MPETVVSSPLCSDTVQVPLSIQNTQKEQESTRQLLVRWLKAYNYEDEAYRIGACGTTFIHLRCQDNHEKYVRMHCNHDYCPTCGTKWSAAHKKRATRAMDRLVYLKLLGYMVFTLPDHFMAQWPDKEALKYLSKEVWNLVKRHFETGGAMVRTHLMGEKGDKLHIHFNVLFDITQKDGIGEVPKETLIQIRKEWTDVVNKWSGLKLENTNVWYNFFDKLGQKIHKVKYILRPIVTSEKFLKLSPDNKEYVLSLKGWHNTRWFGKLANSQYKKYLKAQGVPSDWWENKDIGISKRCPICKNKFKRVSIIDADKLPRDGFRRIDNDILVDFALFSYLNSDDP